MSIKKLNPLKNRIFGMLTGSFRNSKRINLIESLPRDSEIRVLITRPNHRLGNQLIKALFNSNKKTICIFTFATGNKCLSKKWWLKFYKELKTEFTDFNILEILPFENVSQINFKSTHFYSKNLREIASIIEISVVFIGADSGIMHLSSSTNTTTFGLFNVTNPKTYGPYGGNNMPLDTNSVKISEIIERIKEAIF